MPTNHPTPELLSDEQVAEIEARLRRLRETDEPWESKTEKVDTFKNVAAQHALALCATVRALREKHTRLAETSDEWASLLDRIRLWSKCADGYPLDEHINNITTQNTALRNQLAQADETNRLAGLQIVELESRLAQVEKERDALEEKMYRVNKGIARGLK